ncbi:unnamed protein product [Ilex paraguariensis]|uniref:Uncharacterized protein n=1 Tax=Ilex paraguariensis TaxID=185542 RepID=A0ABC8RS50_9AQUA
MDTRRTSRVIDPKVRKVGFFTPGPTPDRTQSGPLGSSPPAVSGMSPSNNSLSPVWIPPPRHASDNMSRAMGVPVPTTSSQLRRGPSIDKEQVIESYNASESLLGTSPVLSPPLNPIVGDGEFSEDSVNWIRRSNSGKFASSLPGGGFDLIVAAKSGDLKKVHRVSSNGIFSPLYLFKAVEQSRK